MIPPDPYGGNGILASVPPERHAFALPLLPPVETATVDLIEVPVDGLWPGVITIGFVRKRIQSRSRGSRWTWIGYWADKVLAAEGPGSGLTLVQ